MYLILNYAMLICENILSLNEAAFVSMYSHGFARNMIPRFTLADEKHRWDAEAGERTWLVARGILFPEIFKCCHFIGAGAEAADADIKILISIKISAGMRFTRAALLSTAHHHYTSMRHEINYLAVILSLLIILIRMASIIFREIGSADMARSAWRRMLYEKLFSEQCRTRICYPAVL